MLSQCIELRVLGFPSRISVNSFFRRNHGLNSTLKAAPLPGTAQHTQHKTQSTQLRNTTAVVEMYQRRCNCTIHNNNNQYFFPRGAAAFSQSGGQAPSDFSGGKVRPPNTDLRRRNNTNPRLLERQFPNTSRCNWSQGVPQ